MIGTIILMWASQTVHVDKTIRETRASYNRAIAVRDTAAIGEVLTPNYVVLPGLTGTPLSKAELLALFKSAFADSTFVTYSRHPEHVALSGSAKRIAERGRWVGIWNKHDGVMKVSGVYQAFWIPADNGWKLINESFVTLQCKGSRECASID
jgi:ketosteroid isomerase-like protein